MRLVSRGFGRGAPLSPKKLSKISTPTIASAKVDFKRVIRRRLGVRRRRSGVEEERFGIGGEALLLSEFWCAEN